MVVVAPTTQHESWDSRSGVTEGQHMSITETAPRRVLVVDDHATFTDLVAIALERHPALRCVATAHSATEALAVLQHEEVDVVLIDVRLGDDDGLMTAAEVRRRRPDVSVVVLTAYPDTRVLRAAAVAGVSTVLPKNGAFRELVAALTTVTPSHFHLAPGLARLLATSEDATRPAVVLTTREHQVLAALAAGHDITSISRELCLSVHTCRGYVKSVLRKLGAHTQLEAVVVARRLGLVLDQRPA